MKKIAIIASVVFLAAGFLFAGTNLRAEEPAPPQPNPPAEQPPAEQPPAAQPPAEQPPAEQPPAEQPPSDAQPAEPEGPPYDGATNARDLEVQEFFDALNAIQSKADALKAAVTGAATPEQVAQATAIRKELEKFQADRNYFITKRWVNWPEFVQYDKGIPMDRAARFGTQWCRFGVGDFNEDGKLDLAAVSFDNDGLYAWLNNGDGSWTEDRKNLNNAKAQGGIAVAADFDGDGHVDLVFGAKQSGFFEYKGDGKGNWEPVQSDLPLNIGDLLNMECADMEGDGDIDLVVTGLIPQKAVLFENDGKGKFTMKNLDLPPEFMVGMFTLADVNNDKKTDFIGQQVYINEGDNKWSLSSEGMPVPENYQFTAVACGDLNGDGFPDVVITGNTTEGGFGQPAFAPPRVFLNSGKGQWKAATVEGQGRFYNAIDIADINGDGNNDIILLNAGDGKTTLILDDGKGGFKETPGTGIPTASQAGNYLQTRDIDGDGCMDIVVYYATFGGQADIIPEGIKTFHVWRNNSVYQRINKKIERLNKTLAEIK